ncbi:AraC family transcriptional regulator [Shimia isoporae]|uniref:AraC family transcriptional regulator n=1 Tax=Shimia isoporae TaxID=647720 RepID=A0A4R1N0N5_9RHOB|nr:AraC family transcriptional regulator [Shimia isoporae]TCK99274.1 AraC family transcriptional regulator [Shimia isoporae]
MSIILPEYEYVDRATETIRYLEHGWPTDLCRWHSHEEYELHLITATRGKAFVGDYIGDFKPGALFLTGPNLPHNWVTDEITSPEPVEIRDMLVQFHPENVKTLTQAFPEFNEMNAMWDAAKSGIEFVGFDPTFARGHFERIRNTRGAERIAAFIRFLVRVNEHAEKKVLSVASVTQPEGNSKQARIGNVVDHIVQNFTEDISLDQAADMANMSVAAFSRNFQKVTGNRFVEFVNRIRIGHACSMLYATDDQVSTICYDVGFQNLANFNRHFLKMKGMTPTEYRETARAELVRKERVDS